MKSIASVKEGVQKQVIKSLFKKITSTSDKNLIRLTKVLEKISTKDNKKRVAAVRKMIEENHPGFKLIKRIFNNCHPNFKEKLITNLITQGFLINAKKRDKAMKEGGACPTTLLISPTMRCNLRCVGCYAGKYSKKDDLPFNVLDRVIKEGKELGVAFFTFLGGEPLVVQKEIFEIAKKHNDAFFQMYTNGTMLTEAVAKKIVQLGNIIPIISIEGWEKETDERRGKGTYKKIMKAMDILKKHRIPFGFSVAVTSKNAEIINSDKFIDFMIEKGAFIGWLFLYMPMGLDPDLKLMPTPKQRRMLLDRDKHIRATKPIFIIDFWNDAPYVGGCIAGKEYAHITSKGDVEPCIFTHFAMDNIKNTTLKKAMASPYFKALRKKQPYHENLYMPCQWIDSPEVSREMFKK
ncbi:radical SAM protein, partial [Candidatus Woesearchaeota archaeon]|nr:radical SAM protein [Candidatus Woesearchaeota archaeon]